MNPIEDTQCVNILKKTIEIIGGKWTFLIIGELLAGKCHFNEMCRDLEINTKSLSDALKNLEANGIISRNVYPTSPVTIEYSLSEKGKDLVNIFIEMYEWGKRWFPDDVKNELH